MLTAGAILDERIRNELVLLARNPGPQGKFIPIGECVSRLRIGRVGTYIGTATESQVSNALDRDCPFYYRMRFQIVESALPLQRAGGLGSELQLLRNLSRMNKRDDTHRSAGHRVHIKVE